MRLALLLAALCAVHAQNIHPGNLEGFDEDSELLTVISMIPPKIPAVEVEKKEQERGFNLSEAEGAAALPSFSLPTDDNSEESGSDEEEQKEQKEEQEQKDPLLPSPPPPLAEGEDIPEEKEFNENKDKKEDKLGNWKPGGRWGPPGGRGRLPLPVPGPFPPGRRPFPPPPGPGGRGDMCGKWNEWEKVKCWWPSQNVSSLPASCQLIPTLPQWPEYMKKFVKAKVAERLSVVQFDFEERGAPPMCGRCARSFQCRTRNQTNTHGRMCRQKEVRPIFESCADQQACVVSEVKGGCPPPMFLSLGKRRQLRQMIHDGQHKEVIDELWNMRAESMKPASSRSKRHAGFYPRDDENRFFGPQGDEPFVQGPRRGGRGPSPFGPGPHNGPFGPQGDMPFGPGPRRGGRGPSRFGLGPQQGPFGPQSDMPFGPGPHNGPFGPHGDMPFGPGLRRGGRGSSRFGPGSHQGPFGPQGDMPFGLGPRRNGHGPSPFVPGPQQGPFGPLGDMFFGPGPRRDGPSSFGPGVQYGPFVRKDDEPVEPGPRRNEPGPSSFGHGVLYGPFVLKDDEPVGPGPRRGERGPSSFGPGVQYGPFVRQGDEPFGSGPFRGPFGQRRSGPSSGPRQQMAGAARMEDALRSPFGMRFRVMPARKMQVNQQHQVAFAEKIGFVGELLHGTTCVSTGAGKCMCCCGHFIPNVDSGECENLHDLLPGLGDAVEKAATEKESLPPPPSASTPRRRPFKIFTTRAILGISKAKPALGGDF